MYLLVILFTLALSLPVPVISYIPATATNSSDSSQDTIPGISNLQIQWNPNGFSLSFCCDLDRGADIHSSSYAIPHVSYQLAGKGSQGFSKGILVHFSEDMADNTTAPTSTPWIALVSCDKNATNASMEEDIFTLARDKGAISALLYSLHASSCVINPEYSDPNTFDQVFDIFSVQSLTSSNLIEYQFHQLFPQNKSILAYDSAKLNNSGADINASIPLESPVSPGYLIASLRAFNSTDTGPGPSNVNTDTGTPPPPSHSPNTALAMIILYAITGCVSALFLVVIISGAIRAVRHPERYGPRARMAADGPAQSRARGLTRAILDTFPVVKFGGIPTSSSQQASSALQGKDSLRTTENQMEMGKINSNESATLPDTTNSVSDPVPLPPDDKEKVSQSAFGGSTGPAQHGTSGSHDSSSNIPTSNGEGSSRGISPPAGNPSEHGPGQNDLVPASIGRETCPICIVDFEEGDDLRVLPCEGQHCFHQACVDPWLLKLSSSCPICRHDFLALENMLSGHPDDEEDEEQTAENYASHQPLQSNTGRFSRYLRFAYRRRQHRRRGDEQDPTDPYMPTAPETSIYPGA